MALEASAKQRCWIIADSYWKIIAYPLKWFTLARKTLKPTAVQSN